MASYYIGLMSGTSLDGVDGVIVDLNNTSILAKTCLPYPSKLKNMLTSLIKTGQTSLQDIAIIDSEIARVFANNANSLLKIAGCKKTDIIAIGSHGQTIFHKGGQYSMQIGHGALIAEQTGIDVVSDFRMNDIAAGGQGAPLTPIYHKYLLKSNDGIIINLGGIANITKVFKGKIIGFDTGPANALLDNWIKKCKNKDCDAGGLWAYSGTVDEGLLKALLKDAYFVKNAPKSTDTGYFNLNWLLSFLSGNELERDVQRTLLELTVISISQHITKGANVYLCGGGVHNLFLCERLTALNPESRILTTNELGIDVDYVEAVAFAFFAKLTLNKLPANLPSVTGAKGARILGAICSILK